MDRNSFDRILAVDRAVFDPKDHSVAARDYDEIPAGCRLRARLLLQAMLLIKDREGRGSRFVDMLAWAYWNWLPDYFFEAPASSTGKYHPAFANEPGGLILHSLAAARYADSVMELLDF